MRDIKEVKQTSKNIEEIVGDLKEFEKINHHRIIKYGKLATSNSELVYKDLIGRIKNNEGYTLEITYRSISGDPKDDVTLYIGNIIWQGTQFKRAEKDKVVFYSDNKIINEILRDKITQCV